MSMTELKLSFTTEKLDALRFFMGKKQQDIEQELKEYLDKTYEKIVPAQVREYVESQIEQPSVQEQTQNDQPAVSRQETELTSGQQEGIQQQAPGQGEEKSTMPKEKPVRPSRKQKEQAMGEPSAVSGIVAEAEGLTGQEEGQEPGMTMNMTM